MDLFKIEDNNITVTTECLLVPDLKLIWDTDKTKDKTRAIKELTYVYQFADYKSVYNNYSASIKDQKIKEDIFKDKDWKPSEQVKQAINKYIELQETPTLRLLKGARIAAEEIDNYYRSLKDSSTGINSKNILAISGSLEKIGKMIESFDKLEEKVKRELSTDGRSKAGREINSFEV